MLAAGGKMVEFTGYELPVQFESTGIMVEHKAVREKAGLFDVSHMGEWWMTFWFTVSIRRNISWSSMPPIRRRMPTGLRRAFWVILNLKTPALPPLSWLSMDLWPSRS